MEINTVLTAILIAVFICVGVALVIFLLELVKVLKSTKATIDNLEPTLKNVETITKDVQPAIQQIDPLMSRVQLTLDTVNLEMMRVDQILEDVSDITGSASSATAAVDNLTNAPVKALSNVASRVKTRFGGKSASEESTQLAEQRVAVAQALKEYEQAEAKESPKAADAPAIPAAAPAAAVAAAPAAAPSAPAPAPEVQAAPEQGEGELKTYVKVEEGTELEIDPRVIAESPFFNDDAK